MLSSEFYWAPNEYLLPVIFSHMAKIFNLSEGQFFHLWDWNSYINLLRIGGMNVIMYIKDMMHSRFLINRLATLLLPQIGLHPGEPSLAKGLPWPTSCLSFAAKVEPHSLKSWPLSRVGSASGISMRANPCPGGAYVIAVHTDMAPKAVVGTWPVRLLHLISMGQQRNIWNQISMLVMAGSSCCN